VPERVEYFVGRSIVGCRLFDSDGQLQLDYGIRRGKRHGREYRLDLPGKLLSATAYRNGLEHGVARQWSDGRLIGTYRMKNGTGVDLWWQDGLTKRGRPYLAEVHFMLNGHRQGFEWWLNEGQQSVYQERHWSLDDAHGIEREWNEKGTLSPGFPKFYIRGRRVTRKVYERERDRDRSLPPYRIEENQPQRDFPPVVARRLAK
jgi:antitoxin component YwqK of YwqJK toxin-antitoxin module